MFPSRYVNLDAARARFGDRVDRVGAFFVRSDPQADAAVSEMAALEPGRAFALLEELLSRGAGSATGAAAVTPPAMRDLLDASRAVPAWVDWPTIDRGGEVLHRAGIFGGLVLGAMSLPLGYASPGGNKPLVFSGRLTEQAPRRLNETSRFVQAVCQPGGLRPGADGFNITVKVRIMHAHVRRMLVRSGRWDEASWGVPINQHDMAATTILFSAALLEGLRRFGFVIGNDEAEAYMHLWRWVGHLSGVDAELLPCSELDARTLGELIHATQGPPDDDSRALVRALVDSPFAAARNEREMRTARYRSQFARGLVRGLLGEELASSLGVEPTAWQNVMRVARTTASVGDRAARLSSRVRRRAISAGQKYWADVTRQGLSGGPYDFRPQDRLGRTAPFAAPRRERSA